MRLDLATLVRRAGRALYEAKRGGRGRACRLARLPLRRTGCSNATMRYLLPLLALCCASAHAGDYPSTIAAYLARFDRDGDGRIATQEYVDYLSAGFYAMDANGDGVLEADELPPGPRRTPRTLAAFQADLRAQFHRMDRDSDGFLSAPEMARPPG